MDYSYENVATLAAKHELIEICFDTECIYDLGDLSGLLQEIADKLFPGHSISITECLSPDKEHYVAKLQQGNKQLELVADTSSDWLPDVFFEQFEKIPQIFGNDKVLYSINPAVGLTGQEAMYFYGSIANLSKAREEGLLLIYPGENFYETPEYKNIS